MIAQRALGAGLLAALLASCASVGGGVGSAGGLGVEGVVGWSPGASVLRPEEPIDPLSLLAPGASVYLRADGAAARLLAPSLVPAEAAASLAPLLERTETLAVGASPRSLLMDGRLDAAAHAKGGSPLPPAAAMDFEAALVGKYPFRLVSLGIGVDRRWKREGGALRDPESGIRAVFPGPRLALASNSGLKGMLARARSGAQSPLPQRLGEFGSGAAILLWVPDPLAGLVSALGLGKSSLPLRGFALRASRLDAPEWTDARHAAAPEPDGDGARGGRLRAAAAAEPREEPPEGAYEIRAAFLMADPASARLFRPALRLAWYALARSVFGADAGPFLAADFALEAELYSSSGIELSTAGLAKALAALLEAVQGTSFVPARGR